MTDVVARSPAESRATGLIVIGALGTTLMPVVLRPSSGSSMQNLAQINLRPQRSALTLNTKQSTQTVGTMRHLYYSI